MIIIYLIKSTLCLGILFGFYKIALESKAMHQFKRFYLLASLLFAFIIPLVTFTYKTVPVVTPILQEFSQPIYTEPALAVPVAADVDYTDLILWSIYGLGILVFGARFFLNLVRLKRKINTAEMVPDRDFTLALLGKTIVPHSFFKWIFLNKNEYLNKQIAPEVLAHEATHVRQKHSVDILFIEFLQVIFWFNPLIWLSKKSIKLNHEFLADQGAIENKSNIAIYQSILLSYASSTHHTALESPFNYSLTKKRIVMLSQSFSKRKVVLRAALLVPVIALCVLFFNQAIVAQAKPNDATALIPGEPIATKWLELWQNKEEYKLFLDEVPIDNETILTYKSEELPYYEAKYKDGQTHVSIWTKDYWKKQNEIGYSEFSNTDFKKVPRVHINGKEITINGNPSSIETYVNDLNTLTQYWTTEEYRSTFPIVITVENRDEKFIKLFDQKLQETNHWKATISYNKPQQQSNYATQFIEGAQRNGKNAIVIEVKNDSIYVNGTYTTISNLSKTIDAVTANWSSEEYADPMRSIIFKGNTEAFIQRAEKEFQKTALYRANTSLRLIPPPPPAPASPAAIGSPPPPPPPVSPEEHFVKMRKLGGKFFYEGEKISFEKAISILKKNKFLNVQTPFPYSDPPRTFIGKVAIPNLDITPSIEQTKGIKRGDTLTITDTETRQKSLVVMEDSKYGIIIDKLPEGAGIGVKELVTYNRLAKKYNANPTGNILQGEVALMYEIYTKMNVEQKKNAETYPILPPPPPPAPVKVIKGVNDGDKNNPPPPKKDGYSFNNQPKKTLGLFSKIEEYPEDNVSVEVPENLSFTPSSMQTVSQNIKLTEDHDKVMDSILATYNLTREDVDVKTTTISRKEPTLDTYSLGGYSVSIGLNKDYSQEYQVTQSSSFTIQKPNDWTVQVDSIPNLKK